MDERKPLIGLPLGKKSDKTGLHWRIGAKIGSSKYSSVHEVVESCSSSNAVGFVVKLTMIKTAVVEAEKRRKALQNETLICECKLKHYQGDVITKLPREVKSSGYVYGGSPNPSSYKYLICEKMSGSLWDIVPALLENQKGSQACISISPIVQKLFSCVELLHRKKIMLIGCTPQSFMLAFEDNAKPQVHNSKGHTHVSETLASRIRVVDYGRSDNATLEIDPIYSAASSYINQRPPSYRDDLVTLGYIIGELIIRITIAAKGKAGDYESDGRASLYLPWSSQRTLKVMDDEKMKATTSLHSDFYGRMIDRNVANTIYRYFKYLGNHPDSLDYSVLKDMLGDLSLQVQMKLPSARNHNNNKENTPRKTAKGASSTNPRTPLSGKKSSNVAGNIVVEVIRGPHKGEKLILAKDDAETIITVGSAPSKGGGKKPNKYLSLNLDSDVEKRHVSLQLACSERIVKWNVTDLSKAGGTYVNKQQIVSRSNQCMAFVGDHIQVGNTVLELKLK